MSYKNDDGLVIRNGKDGGESINIGQTSSPNQKLVLNLDPIGDEGIFTTSSNTKGLPIASDVADLAGLPANAYIKSATLIVTEAFTSGGAATLTIGLCQADGTVIDADGIDASIALSALAANKVVKCDGALAGGTDTVGANAAKIYFTTGTAAYTAGKANLVIEYIEV